jgi:WXG100 family type VII secretion target
VDGEFKYDYGAMSTAFDEMQSTNKTIQDQMQSEHDKTMQVLSTADGATAASYDQQFKGVMAQIENLSDMLKQHATDINDSFAAMQHLDASLAR